MPLSDFARDLEKAQAALYWARRNHGGPTRPQPKRETQPADYGFIDGLKQARKPYPWPEEKVIQPSPTLPRVSAALGDAGGKPERIRKPKKELPEGMPENVTFYADMGVHAARRYSYCGGGWRAYVLAKALDVQGLE